MARRGDRLGLEFMSGYASTTLALTTASLDVVNAGLQVNPARGAWVARLSLSVGVLGAVGAGFEVYSLNISRKRHAENKSGISERATIIAMGSAGAARIAGLGYGTLIFASVGAFALLWLGAIIAIAWGVSLIAQWVAFRYDKGHILPIHYWLDAGVFGNKKMIDVNEYPNNPFSNPTFNIRPMENLEQDIHAYTLALTEIQTKPKFETSLQGFDEMLSGQVIVTISQWAESSELEVQYIGIGKQELGLDRKAFSIDTLIQQNKAVKTTEGLKVTLDIPKTSHYKAQYLGSVREGNINPNRQRQMQEASQRARNTLIFRLNS